MSPNPKEMEEKLDPRVKRTRSLILQAFGQLLAEEGFESIWRVSNIIIKTSAVLCYYFLKLISAGICGVICGVRGYSPFTFSASIG